MVHALAYVVFILIFTSWVGRELNKKYSLKTHWLWIAAAVISTLIGSFVYAAFDYDKSSNFALHASGGISATFLFVYFTKTLKIKFLNWRLALLILFAWVSMLGVLNELAEYFFELLGVGIFAFDTHDTWRDFVANTIGMLLAWASLSILRLFDSR